MDGIVNAKDGKNVCLCFDPLCSETCSNRTVGLYFWVRFPHEGLHWCILKDKTKLAVEINASTDHLLMEDLELPEVRQ